MTAKKGEEGQPDEITGAKPFEGFQTAASDVQSLLGHAVMPSVDGVQVEKFASERSQDHGYVVVYIPASDCGPHRAMLRHIGAREYWKRSGDSFYRMEHFDIADMFGQRRRPRLRLTWRVEARDVMSVGGRADYTWSIILSLKNEGRMIALYPMVHLEHSETIALDSYGLDGNYHDGLPRRVVTPRARVAVYCGREGDVIHPGVSLDVTRTERIGYSGPRRGSFSKQYMFTYRIAAEGQPLEEGQLTVGDEELWKVVPPLFGHASQL